MLCEVRHKIFVGGGEIFQKHAPVHRKMKLYFFYIILSCFMYIECYLVVILKQSCIEETAYLLDCYEY